jgi:phage gp37-like protein
MQAPVTRIEAAILDRLRRGLGHLSRNVASYGGEMDGEPADVIRQLPGVWVTFGGVQKTEPTSTARHAYAATGRFVVIAGDRNLRSEEATRTGGPGPVAEPGTYRMIAAIRRLLSGQDFQDYGLKIAPLLPGRIRTLFNSQLEHNAYSVFACEFDTKWIEYALENGRYPLENPPDDHEDALFTPFNVQTSPDDPDWLRTRLQYDLKHPDRPDIAEDDISHEPDNR